MDKNRDNTGKFTKGNDVGTTKKSVKNTIIEASIITNKPPSIPREKTKADYDYEDFRQFGSDNLFPQALAMLNRRGTTHRGIMTYKNIFTRGAGFIADENNSKLHEFIKSVNGRESFRSLYKKQLKDWFGFGNTWLEIVTDQKRSYLSFFHKDSTKCRLSRKEEVVILHPDWDKYKSHKDLAKTIPLYPEFELIDGALRSIYHFKEYEPEFTHYGIPNWIAGMDAIGIGYKTNKWNLSRLDNSFSVSGLLEVFADPGDKQLKKLDEYLKQLHTDEGNQGKLFKLIKQRGGDPTKFTPFIQNAEGEFIQLHKLAIDDLIQAHNWWRALCSLADNTGFDTQRIRNEYAIASNTVIPEINDFFLDVYRMIIEKEMKIDASSLSIKLKSPVSILDMLNPNLFVKKGEGRRIIGLEVDEDDVRMDEFIQKNKQNPEKDGDTDDNS